MPVKRIDACLRRHGTVGLVLPDPVPTTEQASVEQNFDTDEWDGESPFWQHAVAGSVAGVAEHSVMFPVDTVKTHIQVNSATRVTLLEMVQSQGVPRMWRGVQTMFAGCIPAHAAYFSIYEGLKPLLTTDATSRVADEELGVALGAGAAVSIATVAHDLIMTPMDVMKQRMQLGYHQSIGSAFSTIMRDHGPRGFVVSLPLTLAMNMPHAGVMGTSNEFLKQRLAPAGAGEPGVLTHMVSGACAGALAAAATNPLDVIKTRLQTQHLTPQHLTLATGGATVTAGGAVTPAPLVYSGVLQTCAAVFSEAGLAGFYRGVGARMLSHAPSVAICWTTYETIKHALQRVSHG